MIDGRSCAFDSTFLSEVSMQRVKTSVGPIGCLGSFAHAAAAIAAILISAAPASAICTPAAGNGVTATCTGTTDNQNAPNGYGAPSQSNLDTTVVLGATVTGTNDGIDLNNGSVTNAGVITGKNASGIFGLTSSGFVTVNNSGVISGNDYGVVTVGNVNVTNSGTIQALLSFALDSFSGDVTVVNSGAIGSTAGETGPGQNPGISAAGNATVTNSGVITGAIFAGGNATVINTLRGAITEGVNAGADATVTNSGTITGGIVVGGAGNVTNSGAIIGAGGDAIQFNANGTPSPDILTVLPGARFGGKVDFGGGADTVNFASGSWVLDTANFNKTLSTVNTPGAPYLVTSNQIVVADLSGFAAQNRAIMDITGWIASVLPDSSTLAPGDGGGANSIAAVDAVASPLGAFADALPNTLGYAATGAPALKGGAADYADGSAVWAKSFGGQLQQASSGAFVGSVTTGYGAAIGYERALNPDLKVGALVGASANQTNLYQNAGSAGTDALFGGAYGRVTLRGAFLDLAMVSGSLDNSATRTIGGGLALQTATGSYGGWFAEPSMTLGRRFEFDQSGFSLTPALKARYVDAYFDGYTETGSTADLTFGGRDFEAWEGRAEITLAYAGMTGGARVSAHVTGGLLDQQRTSGNAIDIALLDQNVVAAAPDRGSVAGGYVGAGLDWQIGRFTLFAAGEATLTNDAAKSYAGDGGVRVAW
jgi:hypothetical protein